MPRNTPQIPEAEAEARKRALHAERMRRYREKNGQPTPVSFYLGGSPELIQDRKDALDRLAGHHGMNRSQFLQAIADGDLIVRQKAPAR